MIPSMYPKYSGIPLPKKPKLFRLQFKLRSFLLIDLEQHPHLSSSSFNISWPTLTAFFLKTKNFFYYFIIFMKLIL